MEYTLAPRLCDDEDVGGWQDPQTTLLSDTSIVTMFSLRTSNSNNTVGRFSRRVKAGSQSNKFGVAF
jgi:hypothetical protein